MTTFTDISYTYSPVACIDALRADAIYFQPRFDEITNTILKLPTTARACLFDIARPSTETMAPRKRPDEHFTYVEIEDISPRSGELLHWSRIPGRDAPSRARRLIVPSSLLISTVRPNRRAIAVPPREVVGGVCSTGFCVLVPTTSEVRAGFLWAFFRSKYGAPQLERLGRGASYPAIIDRELVKVYVALPSVEVRDRIARNVESAVLLRQRAEIAKARAIAFFDDMFAALPPAQPTISVSMEAAECATEARADPRFFAPEYRAVQQLVRARQGSTLLADLAMEPIHRGVQPRYDPRGEIGVLNTKSVQRRRVEWKHARKTTIDAVLALKQGQVAKGDVVITSTGEGSWGRAAYCDIKTAFADNHVAIVRLDRTKVDPLVLVAFLWSDAGRIQLEQRVRGATRQTEIPVRDIGRIGVPKLSAAQTKKVRRDMAAYYRHLNDVESLQASAIAEVEEFIEKGIQ